MTKYLVVGAGLFGATFAHEAAKRGHEVKVIEKRDHMRVTSILRKLMVFKFISMGHTFSILLIGKFGIM